MSGTDYTKKGEIGNSDLGTEVRDRASCGRIAVLLYDLAFLYRGRGEKLVMAAICVMLAVSAGCLAFLAAVFERPAPIFHCDSGSGSGMTDPDQVPAGPRGG